MGRPRMILLIRHAQSEGNKNRAIHQTVPDHRVKLTEQGHQQALACGVQLRSLLRPDDTLQIYTSPYRRTRETTQGIVRGLTDGDVPFSHTSSEEVERKDVGVTNQTASESGKASVEERAEKLASGSLFSPSHITVYEEPRLREQDFGNFQPCSEYMDRMWRERSDYGHFFFRIPNGESAADAYDRVAGFNESLWRAFGDEDFPSVCVLVTHGLMTRIWLMKWFHWQVEEFEDLRNVSHCEVIVLRLEGEEGQGAREEKDSKREVCGECGRAKDGHGGSRGKRGGKYVLETPLRTWSALRKKMEEEGTLPPEWKAREQQQKEDSSRPRKGWGGCPDGCNHEHDNDQYPRRQQRRDAKEEKATVTETQDKQRSTSDKLDSSPIAAASSSQSIQDTTQPSQPPDDTATTQEKLPIRKKPEAVSLPKVLLSHGSHYDAIRDTDVSTPHAADFHYTHHDDDDTPAIRSASSAQPYRTTNNDRRSATGSTAYDGSAESEEYFSSGHHDDHQTRLHPLHSRNASSVSASEAMPLTPGGRDSATDETDWIRESGMGRGGGGADALGDVSNGESGESGGEDRR